MCYGNGCKYEINYGPHELTGECSISDKLGTNDMPLDAECKRGETDDIQNA